ncbi:MAG TPA: cation diffusion facilitator family transporter [Tepidisphaeraceae bacterium]|jgi:cation diffusion facilitator family transporter|nr:cation diffusion facilitator family transporter [Tepidisphaeraceae bacterium]
MRSPLAHVPKPEARAAVCALVAALALVGLKFLGYFITGSAAIFSDALESVVNVAAAVLAIWSLYLSHLPADREHPYGHGKIEFVSAGFEGGMILLAGLIAVGNAILTLIHGIVMRESRLDVGLALLAVALAVNGGLGIVLLRLGKTVSSATLEADGHHLLSDAVTSIAAIAGLLAVKWTGFTAADPIAAIVVAIYITFIGFRLVRRSLGGLMDRQDIQDQQLIGRILDSHLGPTGLPPRICSYHKVRHRHSGRYHWVDFHIRLPPEFDVRRGHEVATQIEREIQQALVIGNATAHVEPCGQADCASCRQQREENTLSSMK